MVSPRRFPVTLRAILYVTVLLIAPTPVVRAQEVAVPAHIAFVDPNATLERDGQAEPASVNTPLVAGDRLRTTIGRAEVLFPDGTVLDVDEYSLLDLQSPTLMRLVGGRVLLVVASASNPAAAVRYQIDTPAASVRINGPGEYRVAVLSGREHAETELAVLRGSAALVTERGPMPIRAGERSVARENEAPSFPQAFNSARFDAFDRWSAARRDARTGSTSRQYLPPNLQMYGGTFDQYGAWQYAAPYGNVWYPRVAPTWRPYYNGHWAPIRPYGWTWIGLDTWAWPTHHYGRWGFARGEWFWAPASQWAPAWVSWGVAPGYVSWCSLGVDNRPVFALGAVVDHPWAGWVVVPRTSFGVHGDLVNRHAVAPDSLPRSAPFVVQSAAPASALRVLGPQGPIYVGGDPRAREPQGPAYVPPIIVPPQTPTIALPRPPTIASGPAAPRYEVIPPSYRAPMPAPATAAPRTPDPQRPAYVLPIERRAGPVGSPTITPPRAPAMAVPRSAPAPAGPAPAAHAPAATAPRSGGSHGAAARR